MFSKMARCSVRVTSMVHESGTIHEWRQNDRVVNRPNRTISIRPHLPSDASNSFQLRIVILYNVRATLRVLPNRSSRWTTNPAYVWGNRSSLRRRNPIEFRLDERKCFQKSFETYCNNNNQTESHALASVCIDRSNWCERASIRAICIRDLVCRTDNVRDTLRNRSSMFHCHWCRPYDVDQLVRGIPIHKRMCPSYSPFCIRGRHRNAHSCRGQLKDRPTQVQDSYRLIANNFDFRTYFRRVHFLCVLGSRLRCQRPPHFLWHDQPPLKWLANQFIRKLRSKHQIVLIILTTPFSSISRKRASSSSNSSEVMSSGSSSSACKIVRFQHMQSKICIRNGYAHQEHLPHWLPHMTAGIKIPALVLLSTAFCSEIKCIQFVP